MDNISNFPPAACGLADQESSDLHHFARRSHPFALAKPQAPESKAAQLIRTRRLREELFFARRRRRRWSRCHRPLIDKTAKCWDENRHR